MGEIGEEYFRLSIRIDPISNGYIVKSYRPALRDRRYFRSISKKIYCETEKQVLREVGTISEEYFTEFEEYQNQLKKDSTPSQ